MPRQTGERKEQEISSAWDVLAVSSDEVKTVMCEVVDNEEVNGIKQIEKILQNGVLNEAAFAVVKIDGDKGKEDAQRIGQECAAGNGLHNAAGTQIIHEQNEAEALVHIIAVCMTGNQEQENNGDNLKRFFTAEIFHGTKAQIT